MNLPEIDEALDAAKDRWDHADAPYDPTVLALIRAAETMRAQLYGSHRDDVDPMPVFVLRGRDRLAVGTIEAYRRLCEDEGLVQQDEDVRAAIEEMEAWQRRNPGLMKLPDHAHVPALPHARDMAPLLGRLFDQDAGS